MIAPACPLTSWGSACRRTGWDHSRHPHPSRRWPVELHREAAADHLAEAVAQALGCDPWPALGLACRQGALQALRWYRTRPDG